METEKYNPNHHEPSAKTMREALKGFKCIEPQILKSLRAKGIRYFEDHDDNQILHHLDRHNGIDSMVIYDDNQIRFMANRIQYNQNYKTFTVRETFLGSKNTEYQKRKDAINDGYAYPHLTSQVYLNKKTNSILSMAFVRTSDLYEYIDEHQEELKYFVAKDGGLENGFIVVEWQKLIADGVLLVVYENGETKYHNNKYR